ncbi:hypothetical protein H8L32_16850 [Undibacterium sp. CY18W]|uniref:Uncharacterized protein n=1 Tax=Undibacterium hunanense TaxID=2762292 RepID=A0ABR6ZUD0_9BURK|nr:hypothetical protein [Undibacterium hunanense]MBC3919163.1 hypothetical protein [Undibacterium hunanense]
MSRSKNTAELQGPVAPDITMPASGGFSHDDVPDIEVVADVMADKKDWADKMNFMNETVCIRIQETTNPNEEPRVPVCVNGVKSHPVYGNNLPRGIELNVKRYVAEALLRAKPINVRTVKTIDHDGNDTARIVRSIGTAYPFEMINAKPRDTEWLRSIRAQA